MKASPLEIQIEKINAEIKQTRELLKLFLNGEEYFKQKIKKLKADPEQLKKLNEEDLKKKLQLLSDNVKQLKKSKPLVTIYNDGSDEKSKISFEDIQLFVLSSFQVNLQAKFGLIKNIEKLDRVSVFVIEDARLSKKILDNLETCFDHHIQFQCDEAWVQNLLKVNLKKSVVDLKQVHLSRVQQSNVSQPSVGHHHQKVNDQKQINHQQFIDQPINHEQFNNQQVTSYQPPPQSMKRPKSFQMCSEQTIKLSKEFENVANVKPNLDKNQTITRKDLLLSIRQLIKEHYPLAFESSLIQKAIKSKFEPVTETSPMFAIDCEMCKTEQGELDVTRISLIDEQMNVLMDEFVKPKEKIVDYLTQFSGISEADLQNVTTTLEDVHQRLDQLLPGDAILVGHSLNCDLQSLQLTHPYVIDTSCIYNFSFYYNSKPSLKQLSAYYLRNEIQNEESGHCSIEDAKAAMQLVQLKLSKDITFGDNRLTRQLCGNISKPTVTLAEFLKLKDQSDVKIVYDYLELESLRRFISINSKHLNKIVDKISWSLSQPNSICIVILKGKCLIKVDC